MFSLKSLVTYFLLLQTAAAAGYVNAAYYGAWTTYSGFTPEKLNVGSMSHIIYAFAKISSNGNVVPSDPWADYQQLHPGDVAQTGNNAYGNVKQLYLHKKANRKLKTLLSIGGYEASVQGQFLSATKNSANRKRFVDSSIKLMLDWGMDGIDLDWEYPATTAQGENLYILIRDLRAALDKKASALGQKYRYLITAATPAGPANYAKMPLGKMNSVLDFFNLMAYDYSGQWSPNTAHHSNLYVDKSNTKSTPFSTDKAVKDYIAKGVSAKKINIGIPLYGRSFAKSGGLGKSFKGTGSSNADGTIPFKNLPKKGAVVKELSGPGALVTWDSKTKEVVVLDGGYTGKLKAAYAKKLGLAGAFFWEASGDKTGSSSLITIVKKALGTLQDTNNQLAYPSSQFVNMKNGMPKK